MSKNVMAVFDEDEEYVLRLTEYFNDSKPQEMEIQGFTDIEYLKDFAKERELDVLLVQDGKMCDDIEEMRIGEIMVLSEGEYDTVNRSGHRTIYKFQSTENIVREVMSYYAEEPETRTGILTGTKGRLIGVYSPVRRSLKTSFAICLGQILSHTAKVLYVDLEDFHGFNSLFHKNYMSDMSDLLFYVQQKKKNFPFKLASVVEKLGGLDMIPPVVSPDDIKSLDKNVWLKLLKEITDCDYDYVILDPGEGIREIYQILRLCETVYTPVRHDLISEAKMEQYETYLRIMESDEVMEKTIKLDLPFFSDLDGNLERIGNTSLGDYIREMIGAG